MNIRNFKTSLIILLSGLVYACSNDQDNNSSENIQTQPVESVGTSVQTNHEQSAVDKFTPNYISADELNRRFETSVIPYIFDVRSKPAFEKSHIESAYLMPYGKTDDEMLANTSGLSLDSEIITYCGCPRHLSSLSAKDLTERGYKNVKVLYEGFWHWKDSGYPTVIDDIAAELTQLQFTGAIASSNGPVSEIDIFLKHPSGQLEAAKTNLQGEFDVKFNLYDYKDTDLFEIILTDINDAPVKFATGSTETVTQLTIEL